jgi:hypothetical protein
MTAKPTLVLVGPAVAAGLLLSLWTLLPAPVHAQSCALLPPGTPAEGAEAEAAVRQAAVTAVATALSGEDVTVLPTADVQRRLVGEPFAACNALDCGSNVVRSLGVDFAALVTVWAPRGTPTSVVVTLIGPSDSVAGDAPVEEEDVEAAALAALTTAWQRWRTSQMGFLVVSSEPPGADVEVDGRVIGQTPLRHLVPAGERRVRLLREGYETAERTVRVTATEEHALEVTLTEAVVEPPEPVGPPPSEPHWANWLIGGALAAGGVAALVSPIHTLARLDECTQEVAPGLCRRGVQFGVQSGVLTGLGVAALAAGVVFFVAPPLQVTPVVTPDSARIEFRGTF